MILIIQLEEWGYIFLDFYLFNQWRHCENQLQSRMSF